jgi:hypothetical protein
MNANTNAPEPPLHTFAQRPRVRLGNPDFVVEMGDLRLALFSKEIEPVGLVQYKSIVVVVNTAGEEVLYIGAETNPFDGHQMMHLGMFTPDRHVTVLSSPLLSLRSVVFMAACALTRNTLYLPDELAPLTDPEIEGVEIFKPLINAEQPDWKMDDGSLQLISLIFNDSFARRIAQHEALTT